MRLFHFFVVVAAAFLATGAVADSEPNHRNLRKHHHTLVDEERGIQNIPLERLNSLARKVGVNADDILDDAAAAMRRMSSEQQQAWSAGLTKLMKFYKSPKQQVLAPSANRPEIKQWIKDTADVFRLLYHPRFHAAPFAEFAMLESREYYRIKKEKTIGRFQAALDKTPELVEQANKFLEQLEPMFHSSHSVNKELSYDDIDLFGRLRGLTLVRDLEWPPKLREYLDYMSEKADIPLLDNMAVY